jgi:hypothetical protein
LKQYLFSNAWISSHLGQFDIAYIEIKQVIQENNAKSISMSEAATRACERNHDVKHFLLGTEEGNFDNLKLSNSWQLKEVLRLIRKNEHIPFTSKKPIMLRWKEVKDQLAM